MTKISAWVQQLPGDSFVGIIDDVVIYDRELTLVEMRMWLRETR